MSFIRKIFLCFATLLITYNLFAQNANQKPAMADEMHSNGKIYVVVAVVITILIGLFLYVWFVDRKISKLEKENKS